MKRALLTAAAYLALMSVADAADLETVTGNWEGPYIGLNAGYAGISTELQGDPDGATANDLALGVQAGYNVQRDSLVFGVEGDFSALVGDEIDFDWAGGKDTYIADHDWFGTIRARAGYATDSALLYVTVGAAFLDLDAHLVNLGFGDSKILAGLAVGAGSELMISESLSGKIEYLYADFGTEQPIEVDHDASMHVIRAGLNYHF